MQLNYVTSELLRIEWLERSLQDEGFGDRVVRTDPETTAIMLPHVDNIVRYAGELAVFGYEASGIPTAALAIGAFAGPGNGERIDGKFEQGIPEARTFLKGQATPVHISEAIAFYDGGVRGIAHPTGFVKGYHGILIPEPRPSNDRDHSTIEMFLIPEGWDDTVSTMNEVDYSRWLQVRETESPERAFALFLAAYERALARPRDRGV